jgi:hypothetical protein
MNQKFEVLESAETGMPFVRVPGEVIWELVEYFSWQRVRTEYNYESNHCTVYFLFLDRNTAQRLMDDWAVNPAVESGRAAWGGQTLAGAT